MNIIKVSSKSELEDMLVGEVFHVSPVSNFEEIKQSEALIPNTFLSKDSLFGNVTNGFFRLKECVSFFDYREYGSSEWEKHVHKCSPTQILPRAKGIVVFFLKEKYFPILIPWTAWKESEAWSQRIVPHIEVGFKGEVPLNYMEKIVIYTS